MNRHARRPARRSIPGIALATALVLAGCSTIIDTTTDNGPVKTEQRDVSGFSKVSVGAGARLTVTIGSAYHVEITAEEGVLARIRSEVQGDRLVIEANGSISTSRRIEVRVTLPELSGIELSGGAEGSASGVAADTFEVNVSGGSQATVSGTAGSIDIAASGGSQAHLRGLSAGSAHVDASGGSRAELSATDAVSGTASGGSTVDLWGGASLAVDTSGGSEAHSH